MGEPHLAHENTRTTLEESIATTATFDEDELTGAERRMYRARNERMVVVPQVGADRNATGLYNVYSESGETYLVDVVGDEKCTCKDARFNEPDTGCKHVKRVRIMLDETPLPAPEEPVAEFFDLHLLDMAKELRAERERLERRKQTLGFFLRGLRDEFEDVRESETVLTTPGE